VAGIEIEQTSSVYIELIEIICYARSNMDQWTNSDSGNGRQDGPQTQFPNAALTASPSAHLL
jgi:hypothetical protein